MNTILGILICSIIACVSFIAMIKVFEKHEDFLLDKSKNKLDISPTICRACRKHRTMDCPNSSRCYATEDKPYFEPIGDD